MSGDLEDFLRRAAERRQAKAIQQKQNQSTPKKRVPPQYSNRRTERSPRPVQDAEIVEAEVVTPSGTENVPVAKAVTATQGRSRQATRSVRQTVSNPGNRVQSTPASKPDISATALQQGSSSSKPYIDSTVAADDQKQVGFSAEDLVAMLKRPGGVQQALLLREILDRPEHRW